LAVVKGKAMEQNKLQKLKEILFNFEFDGEVKEIAPYGNGHINDTYCVTVSKQDKEERYIFQRMNRTIFQNPQGVMDNIEAVTDHLKAKIALRGGDATRETLCVIPTKNDQNCYVSEEGEFYRMYRFVENTVCYDAVKCVKDFYACGKAFGSFQCDLGDFPAEKLCEVIPGFHDTKARFQKFKKALEKDSCNRAMNVQEEVQFVLQREALACELVDMLKDGRLPYRVTHNDTKLNNILFDQTTNQPICVIDLDTIMPGLSVNDYGDAIRFGASTGAEDEKDLSKIACDLELFEAFTKGFLESCGDVLTAEEIQALPLGAMTMTFECGMRFLTDYLEGDVYFKTHREGHNLDRARTQFKLVSDMEQKREAMTAIVRQCRK